MAKDEFDFDFDFEKEFGLEPGAYGDDQGFDDGMTFTDEELGIDSAAADGAGDDFDFSSLDDLLEEKPAQQTDPFAADFDFDSPQESSFQDIDLEDFSDFSTDAAASMVARKNRDQVPPMEEAPAEEPTAEAPAEAVEEKPKRERKPKEPKERKEIKLPKIDLFTKFVELYFTPVFNKEAQEEPPQDPGTPRRRRKKTKMQIFKEVYLPPIIVVLCMILVMSFAVGAITSAISQRQSDKARDEAQLQESLSAEELTNQAMQKALKEADALATSYRYTEAIEVLENFLASVDDKAAYPEITTERSALVTTQSHLVEYKDPSIIPNLSFHTLMVDPARAFRDNNYGANYNRNFISIVEFQKILDELYNNGYVLIDFDSISTVNGGQVFPNSVFLPQGKKPIMITATMVNYWGYMVNNNEDATDPDATGDGFAHKLVLDENGDIKAAYIDSNGTTTIGDYDLIPILETFIKEHPDFSYQGARATVGLGGKEGVFGYRINPHYQTNTNNKNNGEAYRNEQIAGAKAIANALVEKGYDLACYTYDNVNYGKKNTNQIVEDLTKWESEIASVIGTVDKFIFAQFGDLANYNDSSFKMMQQMGYLYFISNRDETWAEVRSNYVRQHRLMVTGNALGWKPEIFEGIFDATAVVDMATRVSIPN